MKTEGDTIDALRRLPFSVIRGWYMKDIVTAEECSDSRFIGSGWTPEEFREECKKHYEENVKV